MRIYLAGPISGQTNHEVIDYFENTAFELRRAGFETLSPMSAKGVFRTEETHVYKSRGYQYPIATDHAIYTRDMWMVKMCDVLYANLTFRDGKDMISLGTVHEMAWASLLGKHVIVSMGENNPHEHAFILEDASSLFPTHEEAIEYLKKLISGET